jgi:hypothetical protein
MPIKLEEMYFSLFLLSLCYGLARAGIFLMCFGNLLDKG